MNIRQIIKEEILKETNSPYEYYNYGNGAGMELRGNKYFRKPSHVKLPRQQPKPAPQQPVQQQPVQQQTAQVQVQQPQVNTPVRKQTKPRRNVNNTQRGLNNNQIRSTVHTMMDDARRNNFISPTSQDSLNLVNIIRKLPPKDQQQLHNYTTNASRQQRMNLPNQGFGNNPYK